MMRGRRFIVNLKEMNEYDFVGLKCENNSIGILYCCERLYCHNRKPMIPFQWLDKLWVTVFILVQSQTPTDCLMCIAKIRSSSIYIKAQFQILRKITYYRKLSIINSHCVEMYMYECIYYTYSEIYLIADYRVIYHSENGNSTWT